MYRKTGITEMLSYVPGEDLTGFLSVNQTIQNLGICLLEIN